jgi:hypothetical protein
MIDPALVTVLQLCLALLLLAAAWHKLRDVCAFRVALDGYGLLPTPVTPYAAALTIGAELVLGVGLLLPDASRHAAAGSALLLAVYTAAIAINLWRGRTRIDCGCAGPAGALPLSRALVMRNAALIAVSIVAVLPPASRVLHAYDAFLIAIATLTFALLYISAETAMTNGAYGRGAHP